MRRAPEQYRFRGSHPFASTAADGNNGLFYVPHPKITGYQFMVIISDGRGWEHVSVSLVSGSKRVERCPTWAEMCYIKEIFFQDEEPAVQFHPPKSQYVSTHPYCLHLWKPTGAYLPLPDPIMVGNKGDNIQS